MKRACSYIYVILFIIIFLPHVVWGSNNDDHSSYAQLNQESILMDIIYASACDNLNAVKHILNSNEFKNGNVNINAMVKLNVECTVLQAACSFGCGDIVDLLLWYHADPLIQDPNGNAAAHYAWKQGAVDIIKALVSYGGTACINVKNNNQITPLHLAVCRKQPHVVAQLIEQKADIDARDYNGNTPAHIAKYVKAERSYKLLLAAGTDLSIINKKGQTAGWELLE